MKLAEQARILIIQTAFIGDVILATSLIEKLQHHYPNAQIDFLLRKGNEALLKKHPFVHQVLVWDKQKKLSDWWRLFRFVRRQKYDLLVNLQRFFLMGKLTAFSRAKYKVGFAKNPLSFLFSKKVAHQFGTTQKPIHEIERNQALIAPWTDEEAALPKLYLPTPKQEWAQPYVCMAPASVWATKRMPKEKWVALINKIPSDVLILLIGGPADKDWCQAIIDQSEGADCTNMAGQLNLLESAAVMQKAVMNYVNDSAPLHLCSAVNAPVVAAFCSTVPAFGFTPLSAEKYIIQTHKKLACRPCGLHGKKACPEGHFECGKTIKVADLYAPLQQKMKGNY